MATTVRATSTASGASGAVAIGAPTGTVAGDVVVVVITCNAGSANNTADNNGATPFTDDGESVETGNGTYLTIFSRRIVTGDPTTYNFTNASAARWSAIAFAFQNPHVSDIYDVVPTFATPIASGTTIDAPSINTVNDNALHFACAGPDGNANTFTGTPAGYTATTVNTNQTLSAAYKVITPAGATGAQAFSWTNSQAACAGSFAIRDEGGGAAAGQPTIRRFGLAKNMTNQIGQGRKGEHLMERRAA